MSPPLRSTLLVLVFSTFCNLKTTADKAIPLITVNNPVNNNPEESEDKFDLNPVAISLIKELSSPVKVISAIGDARVGKSTALNFIHYTLSNPKTSAFHSENVEEIFETGKTMEAVTHGVWISIISGKDRMDNVILLDVEGKDLEDYTVTDKLSLFTALMSSCLTLFMNQSPSIHIIDFLYKKVRLIEMAFGEKESEYFPYLTAVLRGALATPKGYNSIDEYVIYSLVTPLKWNDNSDEKRIAIGKRFPKERIMVFNLPFISNPETFKDVLELSSTGYLDSIETLSSALTKLPEKKTLSGGVMDGQTLAELAERMLKVMNSNRDWSELNPNFYYFFEKQVCRQSAEEYLEPLLSLSAHDIERERNWAFDQFKKKCNFEEFRTEETEKWEIERRAKEKWNMKEFLFGFATGALGAAMYSMINSRM